SPPLPRAARPGPCGTPSTRAAVGPLGGAASPGLAPARPLVEASDSERPLPRLPRLAQARPPDCLPIAGPLLARLARELGLPGGRALVERYREIRDGVRRHYLDVVGSG